MSATYFISHRWLATDHPDRSGEQVAVALARTWAPNLASPQARAHRAGVWYDWLCLPQAPRTAADEATLERLLPCVYLLPAVSHPLVVLSANSLLASRAWCVAEAVSAFLNGRHREAVSLSMLTTQYGTLVTGERPIGELLERKYVGREPGLLKLAAWIRQADSLHFEPAAAESRLLQEGANWKHCVDVVNQVAIDLRMMMGRAGVDDIAPDRLLHLADDMKLETTVPRDRLPCMQAMARAVRGWRDVARG
jgi:hypothetical protein